MARHSWILKCVICEEYGIDHIKSTPYSPQGNGQAEPTNKTLLRILTRKVYEEPKRWSDHLSLVLWAYRTSKRTSTQATPFSLVYGVEAVVLVEIAVPSMRLVLTSKVLDLEGRAYNIEALEERRQKAEEKWQTYQNQISRAYNKKVKPRSLKVGDLVLKATGHIQKGLNAPKFAPIWEGPYLVREAYTSGYYLISRPDSQNCLAPINGRWLKLYYSSQKILSCHQCTVNHYSIKISPTFHSSIEN